MSMVGGSVSQNVKDRAGAIKTAVTGQVSNVKALVNSLGSFTPVQTLNTFRKNVVNTQASHIDTQTRIARRWV